MACCYGNQCFFFFPQTTWSLIFSFHPPFHFMWIHYRNKARHSCSQTHSDNLYPSSFHRHKPQNIDTYLNRHTKTTACINTVYYSVYKVYSHVRTVTPDRYRHSTYTFLGSCAIHNINYFVKCDVKCVSSGPSLEKCIWRVLSCKLDLISLYRWYIHTTKTKKKKKTAADFQLHNKCAFHSF